MKIQTIIIILVLTYSGLAQNSSFQLNQWNGMIIDDSTPENALGVLGVPDKEKTDSLEIKKISRWFVKDVREKRFRRLEYRKVKGFYNVALSFSENKLVLIDLHPIKMFETDMIQFKDEFKLIGGRDLRPEAYSLGRKPGEFVKSKALTSFGYYNFYDLVVASKDSFVVVRLSGSVPIGPFVPITPNKIEYLQIVSRKLEIK
jgi:hypothetical protein